MTKKSKAGSMAAMAGKFEESLNLSTAGIGLQDTQPPPTSSVIPQYVHQIASTPRSPRSSSEGVQRSGELSREVSGDQTHKRSSKTPSGSTSGDAGGLGTHNPSPPQAMDPQTVAAI